MLNDHYFKTTCDIGSHFLGPMGGLKIEDHCTSFHNSSSDVFVRIPQDVTHSIDFERHFCNIYYRFSCHF